MWVPDQRSQFYGFISGATNLSCSVQAEPAAKFRWLDQENNEIPKERVFTEDNTSVMTVRLF